MSVMAKLLDKCREKCGVPSDNALAELLGVHRQSVSAWRAGKTYPEEERFVEMCDKARVDASAWLAAMHAERAQGIAKRRWEDAARKLGYAAAICLTVYTANPKGTIAAPYPSEKTPGNLYIM